MRKLFVGTVAATTMVMMAGPAFADYYPTYKSRAGFEIEAKAFYGDPSAPRFTIVDLYSYQPHKTVATPRGVDAVCALPDGTNEGVTVGPQGTGPDPLDHVKSDPWDRGRIWGLASVAHAKQNSRRATGAVDVWAHDSRTRDTAHITGITVTDNRHDTQLRGGLTITISGPTYAGDGRPTGRTGTVRCSTKGITPLVIPHAPPPDFSTVLGDYDPNHPS